MANSENNGEGDFDSFTNRYIVLRASFPYIPELDESWSFEELKTKYLDALTEVVSKGDIPPAHFYEQCDHIVDPAPPPPPLQIPNLSSLFGSMQHDPASFFSQIGSLLVGVQTPPNHNLVAVHATEGDEDGGDDEEIGEEGDEEIEEGGLHYVSADDVILPAQAPPPQPNIDVNNLFSTVFSALNGAGSFGGLMSEIAMKFSCLPEDVNKDIAKLTFPTVMARSSTLGLLKNLAKIFDGRDTPRDMDETFVKKYLSLKQIVTDPVYSEILIKHGTEYGSKSGVDILSVGDNLTECFDAMIKDFAAEVKKTLEADVITIQRAVKAYLYSPGGPISRKVFERAQIVAYVSEKKIDTERLLPRVYNGETKDVLQEIDSEIQKCLTMMSPMQKLDLLVWVRNKSDLR